MNWDAIGAIAELLGSVVVLVTLGYLAVQVRHSRHLLEENRKIALSQVYQSRSDTRREFAILVSDSTHLAELLGRIGWDLGEKPDFDKLSREDRVRLRAHYSHIYFHQENNLYQHEIGLLDERTYKLTGETIRYFMPYWKKLNVSGTGSIEEWYEKNSGDGAQQ